MSIELMYWQGRGLMEVPRMLLALAGKFPGDYIDGRYTTDEESLSDRCKHLDDVKTRLTANLGRMPVAQVPDGSIGQSAAINYYIAAEHNLMGAGHLQAAQILAIGEHLKEMNLAYRALIPYGTPPEEEQLDTWFNTGAEDKSPAQADGSMRSKRFCKWWMGRIEACVGDAGIAVGSAISLADVLIYNAFAENLSDEQAGPKLVQYRREAFGSKARTDAILLQHPKLKAICENVAAQPGIQKWLETRGVQNF